MPDTTTLLVALTGAIRAAGRTSDLGFARPAKAAALASLEAALGCAPDELRAWFAWHDGSEEGFEPDSSLQMMSISDALSELEFLKENPPEGLEGATTIFPLLSDGGGGLQLYGRDAEGRPVSLTYDRGEITETAPWEEWLSALVARWREEADVVRVEVVRWSKSLITRGLEVDIHSAGREAIAGRLGAQVMRTVVEAPGGLVRIVEGAESSVEREKSTIVVGAAERDAFRAWLGGQEESFSLAGLKITFVDR